MAVGGPVFGRVGTLGPGRRRDGGPGLLRPIDEPVHFVGQGAWGRLRIRTPGVLLRHRHTNIYDTLDPHGAAGQARDGSRRDG